MADEAPNEQSPAPTDSSVTVDDGERAGDFERYALIAALTLVVLCLLLWDKRQGDGAASGPGVRPDRALRVEIGGGTPGAARPAAPEPAPRTTPDPAPPVTPAPVPPPSPPPRTYVVKSGDTLEGIARRELGSAGRVKDIVDLNAIADASKLKLDQVLKLPAK